MKGKEFYLLNNKGASGWEWSLYLPMLRTVSWALTWFIEYQNQKPRGRKCVNKIKSSERIVYFLQAFPKGAISMTTPYPHPTPPSQKHGGDISHRASIQFGSPYIMMNANTLAPLSQWTLLPFQTVSNETGAWDYCKELMYKTIIYLNWAWPLIALLNFIVLHGNSTLNASIFTLQLIQHWN